MGVFGYADMLMALGLKYGSQEAIDFTNELFNFMMVRAIYENNNRARTKGQFSLCDMHKIKQSEIYTNHVKTRMFKEFEPIRIEGFRNSTLLSIAPTGSIGTMMGLSGGIEPEFALSYIRRTDNLKESYKIEAKVVTDYRNATNNQGELPDYFVTSSQIPWKERVDTQSIIQKHIDTAISSTVNLPKETTKDDIEKLYLYAWQSGLKGITIYRSGCKREGILTTNTTDTKEEPKPQMNPNSKQLSLGRGDILDVCDDLISYKRTIQSGCGKFYVHLDFDDIIGEPLETWLDTGSDGTCERNLQLISRLMSLCLRGGIPIESIIDQCKSIKPCPSYVRRQCILGDCSKGSSCPNAIGFALEELYEKIKDRYFSDDCDDENYEIVEEVETVETENSNKSEIISYSKNEQDWIDEGKCPICHEPLKHEGGCVVCVNDGWSKCS